MPAGRQTVDGFIGRGGGEHAGLGDSLEKLCVGQRNREMQSRGGWD